MKTRTDTLRIPAEWNIKPEILEEGIKRWTPLIGKTLLSHSMTADELVSHLLTEYYGNIDEEIKLILIATTCLIENGTVKASRIALNSNNKMETYLIATW